MSAFAEDYCTRLLGLNCMTFKNNAEKGNRINHKRDQLAGTFLVGSLYVGAVTSYEGACE